MTRRTFGAAGAAEYLERLRFMPAVTTPVVTATVPKPVGKTDGAVRDADLFGAVLAREAPASKDQTTVKTVRRPATRLEEAAPATVDSVSADPAPAGSMASLSDALVDTSPVGSDIQNESPPPVEVEADTDRTPADALAALAGAPVPAPIPTGPTVTTTGANAASSAAPNIAGGDELLNPANAIGVGEEPAPPTVETDQSIETTEALDAAELKAVADTAVKVGLSQPTSSATTTAALDGKTAAPLPSSRRTEGRDALASTKGETGSGRLLAIDGLSLSATATGPSTPALEGRSASALNAQVTMQIADQNPDAAASLILAAQPPADVTGEGFDDAQSVPMPLAATTTTTGAASPTATSPALISNLATSTIETTAQLAAQISRRLEGRNTRFEMALTPDDLGRVDVSLDIDADGGLTARLAFDNPLAATELRGRADELRRQLQDAGFSVGSDALSFSEREAGSSGGGNDQRFERHAGRAFAGAASLNDEVETAAVPPAWISHSQTPQGVDLKV